MKILVILAHPNQQSFNYALAEAAVKCLEEKKHTVIFHDLYRENFDPVLPLDEISKNGAIAPAISLYGEELKVAEGLIFVHPNWWGQPPAILTGWIDRVIRAGIAYKFTEGDTGEGVPEGLLKGKTALVFNTSDTPDAREHAFFGDPLDKIWKKCIFEFCGITKYYRKVFNIVVTSTLAERQRWLTEVQELVSAHFA